MSVSGLYCKVMMRWTAAVVGSIKTRPAFSKSGELGNVLITASSARFDRYFLPGAMNILASTCRSLGSILAEARLDPQL